MPPPLRELKRRKRRMADGGAPSIYFFIHFFYLYTNHFFYMFYITETMCTRSDSSITWTGNSTNANHHYHKTRTNGARGSSWYVSYFFIPIITLITSPPPLGLDPRRLGDWSRVYPCTESEYTAEIIQIF